MGKKKIQYYCEVCNNVINTDEENLYNYKNKYYHMDCLIKKLKRARKQKFSPEEIKNIVAEAKDKGEITTKKKKTTSIKKKPVKLPSLNKQLLQEEKQLIDYIENKYRIASDPTTIIRKTVESLDNGTYKKANGTSIHFDELYRMFNRYEKDLDYAHARLKREIEVGLPLFFYDIAILINKYNDFKNDEDHAQKNDDNLESFEVSDYLKGRNVEAEEDNDDIDIDAFLEGY